MGNRFRHADPAHSEWRQRKARGWWKREQIPRGPVAVGVPDFSGERLPLVAQVLNPATAASSGVSPGQLIDVHGLGLGPKEIVESGTTPTETLDSRLINGSPVHRDFSTLDGQGPVEAGCEGGWRRIDLADPRSRGSIISVYGTGGGTTTPTFPDGSIVPQAANLVNGGYVTVAYV